ncbi:MAG: aspartate carbamoyltransferase regulatory subunit [Candidatus Aenigmarchaeota archaeon ex4484_52]|nr:MAG: aspartate carbamoyltransferase regulatory subunit [Candidatus Aenigmarchaeota archaeon ex4484_52]
MKKEQKIRKIINGTVIDHIKPDCAIKVLSILGNIKDECVIICINAKSKKYKKKDIIKIENKFLKEKEYNELALISPNATISIIKNSKIIQKNNAKIPDFIKGIGKCRNPRCITNYEQIDPEFMVVCKKPIILKCIYCECNTKYIADKEEKIL